MEGGMFESFVFERFKRTGQFLVLKMGSIQMSNFLRLASLFHKGRGRLTTIQLSKNLGVQCTFENKFVKFSPVTRVRESTAAGEQSKQTLNSRFLCKSCSETFQILTEEYGSKTEG